MSEPSSETESALETEPCAGCADLPQLQTKILLLTEKLEYSQLQNSLLRSKCDRLRSQLREAEFKGRSSLRSSPSPSLPNEVLRHIFAFATHFEGLVVSRWDSMAEINWKISSLTRRAIPLVCRKWHRIGLEFLYEHVTLQRMSQISVLLRVLDADSHLQRLGWIRILEFSIREDVSYLNYLTVALALAQKLPEGQLRTFGVDCGGCNGRLTAMIGDLLVLVLRNSGNQLEALHLPCMAHLENTLGDQKGLVGDELQVLEALSTSLSQLSTLSLKGGSFNTCAATCFTSSGAILLNGIKASAISIRTLLINTISGIEAEQFFGCLEGFIRLEKIQIAFNIHDDPIANNLDRFLTAVPHLKHLALMPQNSGHCPVIDNSKVDESAHLYLEEISVHMTTWMSHGWITSFTPFLYKIESGNLPNLQRIVIHGNHPDGCLDANRIFEHIVFDHWADAIETCTKWGITIINQTGHPIHLWRLRHGIILDAGGFVGDSSSNDEEWSKRTDTASTPESKCTHEDISDDEDDQPYQYLSRPDIEQVGPDSDGGEWL